MKLKHTCSLEEKLWQTWTANFADKGPYGQSYGFPRSIILMWEFNNKKAPRTEELMPLNCGAGEDSWESLGQQEDHISLS